MPINQHKNKCLLSTSYLPNIWFFIQLMHFDEAWIEAQEHYQKRSFRNRCFISGPNQPVLLSIPLKKGKNERQPIRKTKIAFHEPWQSRHWHSIQTAYGKTPFYEHYADEIKDLIKAKIHAGLFDYNDHILKSLLELLGISVNLHYTTSYNLNLGADMLELRGKNHYANYDNLNQIGNLTYTQPFDYKQPFHPNLSILDLLFCKGPEASLLLEQAAQSVFEQSK